MSRFDAPTPPLTLRPLGRSEAPALQAVYQAAADFFANAWGQAPHPRQAQNDLAEAETQEGRFLLGIHLADQPVGVIDLRFGDADPPDMRLGLILLAPEHRRRGIGSWAMRILEAWLARDTPVEQVVVAVPANDHAAHSFFLANGYTFTGQSTRVLIGSSRPRLLEMRKNLVCPETPLTDHTDYTDQTQ